MQYPPTIIVRHKRENLKKCSLRGLETREDMLFYQYPSILLPPAENYIILDMDAPPLTQDDKDHGILLLDATWRYAKKMHHWASAIPGLQPRSLPSQIRTAYPRRQDDCEDPERGLASIEALYITYYILGRNTDGLLDRYHWKIDFLNRLGPFDC